VNATPEIARASVRMKHLRRYGIKPVPMIHSSTRPQSPPKTETRWSEALTRVIAAKMAELQS
jgi:hypothetical protein